jgi:hypothetical protein
MLLHLLRRHRPESAITALDVEVAMRLDGFRWVRWRDGSSPDAPRDSYGRFLAREDDPLTHLFQPAPLWVPLAPQPYRHLPRYSGDVQLALRACERAGLFSGGRAALRREATGRWVLTIPAAGLLLSDDSLPLLLTRGALAWSEAGTASLRQGLP